MERCKNGCLIRQPSLLKSILSKWMWVGITMMILSENFGWGEIRYGRAKWAWNFWPFPDPLLGFHCLFGSGRQKVNGQGHVPRMGREEHQEQQCVHGVWWWQTKDSYVPWKCGKKTNHSARKTMVTTLTKSKIPETQIIQLTGHKKTCKVWKAKFREMSHLWAPMNILLQH